MPPLPPLPFLSIAIVMNELTFRSKFPPGPSLLSLPHSHANVHPLGASLGSGGIGVLTNGNWCFSFNQEPWPRHDEKNWLRKGALMTPITGCPSMQKAMETQNMGKRWVKLMVPSRGSTIHVGEDVTRYCFEEPDEYDSSPRKLVLLVKMSWRK